MLFTHLFLKGCKGSAGKGMQVEDWGCSLSKNGAHECPMTMDGARGQVGIGERSYFQITIILWTLNVLLNIIKDPLGFHVNI